MREKSHTQQYLRLLFPLILFLLIYQNLPGQPPQYAAYHTKEFGSIMPGEKYFYGYSGLAGYAAPDGREYAVLGGYDGTYIIDVSEKPLRLVTYIPGPESIWREIKTFGHYAYVVSEGGSGLQIVDLSGLPQQAALVRADSSVFTTAHTISQEGNYIYVHGSNLEAEANGGTLIFDVSADPVSPQLVGKFADHYVHDATIRNDTMYAAAINDGKLTIVYLGPDRKNPVAVTSITYPGAGTHNADLTGDGRYLMTTDEVGETPKTLKIWDIRNLENISKAGEFSPDPRATIHNVHIKGEYAYVSWYTAGTRILDISDPTNPVEVGYSDAFPGTDQYMRGNWEVYPYLPSGKILSSYTEGGLRVFTFDGAVQGKVNVMVRNAATGKPVEGVKIDFPEINRTIFTDDAGSASFSGAREFLRYVAYAMNYYVEKGEVELSANGTELKLLLRPTPLVSRNLFVVDDITGATIGPFKYRVFNREKGEGTGSAGTHELMLPGDSSYTVEVGAWGYLPERVQMPAGKASTTEIRLKKGYADDAEMALGWTFNHPTDRAYGGLWERGLSTAVYGYRGEEKVLVQPGEDNTGDPATHAFITGLSRPGEYSNQLIGGAASLISPPFDLTGYDDPYINCALWFSNDAWYTSGATTRPDDSVVLAVNNNGGAWMVLATIQQSTDGWETMRFRVRDVMQPGASMRFLVRAVSGPYISLVEAGFDDFSVTEGDPSSAPAIGMDDPGATATARIFPNPLGGEGHLEVVLPVAQRRVRGELFDMLGERVALLHDGGMPAGRARLHLDAVNLSAGRYTWRLMLDDGKVLSGGMVVMK